MQNYAPIPAGTTLKASLPMLQANDDAAVSNNSGTAFPTENLIAGMQCFRTDLKTMFILVSATPATWVVQHMGGVVGKQDTGWTAINAPTLRVVDDSNGTEGGLAIESYQPMLQLLDRDAGQTNVRLRLTGGVLNYEFNDGSDSGAYTLGASTRLNGGNVGIGGVYNPGAALHVRTQFGALTTTTEQSGAEISTQFNESATVAGYGLRVSPVVKDAAFSMANLYGVLAAAPSIGTAATVGAYDAFCANNPPDLAGAYPHVAAVRMRFSKSAANPDKWNLYGDGNAPNFLNGNLYLGSTGDDGTNARLQVWGNVTVHGAGNFLGVGNFVSGISTAGWGRRNFIQNGGMTIAQRVGWAGIGSSYTPAVNATQYLTDRWAASQGGATSAHTLSRVQATDTLGRMRTWACVTVGTGRSNYAATAYDCPFVYTSEAVETCELYNKPITVSFQVRGTIPGTYSVALRCFDGNGAVAGSSVSKFALAAASVAQRVVVTFPATTLLNPVSSNLRHLDLWIGAVAGSTYQANFPGEWTAGANYFSASGLTPWYGTTGAQLLITDVKLEEGLNDTPFLAQSGSDVLRDCRRHLEIGQQPQFYLVSTSGGPTTYMYDTIDFQEPKRAYPTISQWNWAYYGAGGAAIAGTPIVLGVTEKWWSFGYQGVPNLAGWPSQGQWLASSEF